MSYYTAVGYDKETDLETKEDETYKRDVIKRCRQYERQGLVDIQVFYQNDYNLETQTLDWKGGKLVRSS